jgi:hypothetical protein
MVRPDADQKIEKARVAYRPGRDDEARHVRVAILKCQVYSGFLEVGRPYFKKFRFMGIAEIGDGENAGIDWRRKYAGVSGCAKGDGAGDRA